MSNAQTQITTNVVETPSGRISYASAGSGPVALFVHGVVLNKHLWRHQLAGLSDIRRCIAVDLLAHGDTEITPEQDVSVTANARMLKEALDALQVVTGFAEPRIIGGESFRHAARSGSPRGWAPTPSAPRRSPRWASERRRLRGDG